MASALQGQTPARRKPPEIWSVVKELSNRFFNSAGKSIFLIDFLFVFRK